MVSYCSKILWLSRLARFWVFEFLFAWMQCYGTGISVYYSIMSARKATVAFWLIVAAGMPLTCPVGPIEHAC